MFGEPLRIASNGKKTWSIMSPAFYVPSQEITGEPIHRLWLAGGLLPHRPAP